MWGTHECLNTLQSTDSQQRKILIGLFYWSVLAHPIPGYSSTYYMWHLESFVPEVFDITETILVITT